MVAFSWLPYVLVAAAGLALVVAGYLGVRAWSAARLISSTPSTPIAELDPGLHEVRGTLGGDASLEAPLSRQPCVYWRLLLEQRRRNRWETVIDRRATAPLWLDDGSGRVRVDPQAAQVVVSAAQRGRSGIFGVPSGELDELLERLGDRPAIEGPFVRFREELLDAGDRLFAVGVATRDDGAWTLRPDGSLLLLSDRDEAEVVRSQERLARRWVLLAVLAAGVLTWSVGLVRSGVGSGAGVPDPSIGPAIVPQADQPTGPPADPPTVSPADPPAVPPADQSTTP